ncbi:MAG: DNA mismatch repair protein MutS [Deltaproteobacteria bacterium]|nr:DNA mismatch repair protein MutS [Deltaproteobacteria bacterium]
MASRGADTPLMRQYLEIKAQQPDAILFFRLGDFYEMFFEDAVVASEALDLTLTTRDKSAENPVPMCGVPHHAARGYLRRLLEAGHKVAICEQVEDPKEAKGIVKRAVTQVVSPGVVFDQEQLDARENNYLVAIIAHRERANSFAYGYAAIDVSTFELVVGQCKNSAHLIDELVRLSPKELIFPAKSAAGAMAAVQAAISGRWQEVPQAVPTAEQAAELLGQVLAVEKIADGLGMRAACVALRYVDATQPGVELGRCRLRSFESAQVVKLDEATVRNLELFRSIKDGGRQGSLVAVIDRTKTPMGARELRHALGAPLCDVAAIRRRQDAVEFLVDRQELRTQLREILAQVDDVERLTARVAANLASPREVVRLGQSLRRAVELAIALERAQREAGLEAELAQALALNSAVARQVSEAIFACLTDDPSGDDPIRPGFNAEYDRLTGLSRGGKEAILAIEARERERSGIGSLKVRYNKVFGYFIEVTKSNLANVPADYQRKQTLTNAERFVTAELAEHEATVLTAEDKRAALAQQLFAELRLGVRRNVWGLVGLAERIAQIDMLAAFAELAVRNHYTRPIVDDSRQIEIEQGRHPVVEASLPVGEFVPNDVMLAPQQRLLVITGPNMAGKSTVMRQVALITILAHAGCFVPASRCRIGLVDRVFTRVGASDNLARGESTFMVEMRETATIVSEATERSLVILDEIGRGTATYDGISIAWAVAEHLHDRVEARTMFATHYHELCALEQEKEAVKNFNVAIDHWRGKIVFLRKLAAGGANRSFGIDVARLAGLDAAVVGRARRILGALEQGDEVEGLPFSRQMRHSQLGLFDAPSVDPADLDHRGDALQQELLATDVENLTPLQALNRLAELVALAKR